MSIARYWFLMQKNWQVVLCILCCRKLQDDYRTYKASVDKLQEELAQTISAGGPGALTAAAAAGTGPGGESAVCQICRKTQFADGRGNQCSQCGLRSCARCGGKVTFKSDKVV